MSALRRSVCLAQNMHLSGKTRLRGRQGTEVLGLSGRMRVFDKLLRSKIMRELGSEDWQLKWAGDQHERDCVCDPAESGNSTGCDRERKVVRAPLEDIYVHRESGK